MNIGFEQIIPAAKVLFEAVHHRSELAMLELASAREHVQTTTLLGAGGFVLALLGALTANLTLVAAVWDRPDRTLIIGIAALVYLVSSVALVYLVGRRLKKWQPWKETMHQLRNDQVCIQGLFPSEPTRRTNHKIETMP